MQAPLVRYKFFASDLFNYLYRWIASGFLQGKQACSLLGLRANSDYCLSVSIYPSFKFLSNILSFCTVLVHEILQEYNVIIKTDQCNKAEIERIEE